MIKKTIQKYWFKKIDKDATYEKLLKDRIVLSQLNKRYSTLKIRFFFLLLFGFSVTYTMFLKAELYESSTALMVRDLSKTSATASLGLSLLGAGSSSQFQDSMLVEEYLLSLDMFLLLDKEFHLIKHYKSDKLDFIERLSSDATMEQALAFYRKRIIVSYDDTSAIIHLSYAHTDPHIAQKIVKFMIRKVEFTLNEFNRKKAIKQLVFIEKEHDKNKIKMDKSSALLEKYQNDNLLLDPKAEAVSSSAIISGLETTLTQKRIEYKTKSSYLNADNYELLSLKSEIDEISKSLISAKKRLTGSDKNRLNKILFEYSKLKMQLEFDTAVYKTALIQLETTKLDSLKEAKMLSIVNQPNLPDGYTYPNKPKTLLNIVIILSLMYGIFSMLLSIIKDHKE